MFRRGEGERLREEILEAATRLLVETGNEDALSIRAVADAVGVIPPSIYLHFADKNELILAVCERYMDELDRITGGPPPVPTTRSSRYTAVNGEAVVVLGGASRADGR